jgi:hypothetical protein
MEKLHLLTGHVSLETAYFIGTNTKDRRRKKKYCWVDTVALTGDRLVTVTVNSETGKLNQAQYTRFTAFIYLFKDKKGQMKQKAWGFLEHITRDKKKFNDLLAEIDYHAITNTQQFNIRIAMMKSFWQQAYYELSLRKGPVIEHYSAWMKSALEYMKNCAFDQLANYPVLPPYKNGNANPSSASDY